MTIQLEASQDFDVDRVYATVVISRASSSSSTTKAPMILDSGHFERVEDVFERPNGVFHLQHEAENAIIFGNGGRRDDQVQRPRNGIV